MFKQEILPPCNIECEEAILGSILFDDNALARITSMIKPESFFVPAYRKIYEAILDLSKNNEYTNLVFVAKYLQEHGQLDEVGGMPALAKLLYGTVSATNIDRYAIVVRQKYVRRQLIHAANEIEAIAHDSTIDIKEVVSNCQSLVLDCDSVDDDSVIEHASSISSRCYDRLDERKPIYSTGLVSLDQMMTGFEPGTMTVLAGRPSMAKTAIANFFAFQCAVNQNFPVIYFSLEMTKEQMQYRLWSLISRSGLIDGISPIRTDRIRKHRSGLIDLEPRELDSLVSIISFCQDLNLYVCDDRSISVEAIASKCRQIKNKHSELGLVIVDYLQMMKMTGGSSESNRSYELGEIGRSLYKMAGELDCPVIALSQVGRGVEQRSDKRPMMSDLSQSGILEMVADNIIFAYREEYYDPTTPKSGILELILAKARHGDTGKKEFLFDKSCGLIKDFSQSSIQSGGGFAN